MEPTHQNATSASTVILKCALIVLLLSGLISQCSASCRRLPLTHVISHEGCIPKHVPSFGCRGTCTSYSRVSPTDYTRMERSCQCCQEANHQTKRVTLYCPRLYRTTRTVGVRVAESCTCRPCHGSSGVPSVTRLEDLLE